MIDPISVGASVVGLISLGLQVTQSLVDFYQAYKAQDTDLARTVDRVEHLQDIFQTLQRTLASRKFRASERDLITTIERCVHECEDLIIELQEQCEKLKQPTAGGVSLKVKAIGRRVTYPFRQSTLQKLDEDVAEIKQNLLFVLSVLQVQDTSNIQDETEEIKSLLALVRASQVSNEIRQWLSAPDVIVDYHEACSKRYGSTGQWLVAGTAFQSWLSKSNSCLWLNGFAGCGKSVLSSTAIQHMFRYRKSNPRVAVAIFYFRFNDTSKQGASSLVRALLLQLSSQSHDGQSQLDRLRTSYNNSLPPLPVLVDTLRRLIQGFEDVYLVLDALDETPRRAGRDVVLDTLCEMQRWSMPCLHLLITSRNESDIRQVLDVAPENDISMKNVGVDKDIADFVSANLEQSRGLRKFSTHQERIKQALTSGAQGVFRWVECQFRSLKTCPPTKYHLEKLLQSLPESLEETYERMLLAIDSHIAEDARRILTLLCMAKRPLTVREVIDGTAVDLDDHFLLNRERRLPDADAILEICPGLVDVVVDSKNAFGVHREHIIVQIAHNSVQEYLESNHIRRSSEHGSLECSGLLQIMNKDVLDEMPMAEYAARYWLEHYPKESQTTPEVETLALRLLATSQHNFHNSIRIYDEDHNSPNILRALRSIPSPIYYMCLSGYDTLLHKLLEQPQFLNSINPQGGKYGNAMQAASAGGHKQAVEILLSKGADVNIEGGDYGTALQAASAGGHKQVVEILLSKGADVNIKGGYYGTALKAASARGHEAVIEILLSKTAK